MRPLMDMTTSGIQIEITNHCINKCSNCTRFIGHHTQPYYMDFDYFQKCIDSMAGWPGIVGFLGGEPLLHPEFERLCNYAVSKIPKERLGLWTCLPTGFEHYREIIVHTFSHIFINDHTKPDVLHQPLLVSPSDLPLEKWLVDYYQNRCWVQNSWSATMNPRGGFFCEVAGALSMLTKNGFGWAIKPGWWKKSPLNFLPQMKRYCTICGAAFPMKRRASVEGVDDVSPFWKSKLHDLNSPKLKAGKVVDAYLIIENDERETATYKDMEYREQVAARYGMMLMVNEMGYCTPYLRKSWREPAKGVVDHGKENEA